MKHPGVNFNETYLGDTAGRLRERVLDHVGYETGYASVCMTFRS